MIASVLNKDGSVQELYEDVRAVVHDGNGWLRVCRDGMPDEVVQNLRVVVTS